MVNFDRTDLIYSPAQGTFIVFAFPTGAGQPGELSRRDEYFTGRVITMMDGPARGQSTRIVQHKADVDPSSVTFGAAELRMLPFASMRPDGATNGWAADGAPRPGDRFLINPPPFSGTGFGYEPTQFAANELLDAVDPTFLPNFNAPYALLPNAVYFQATANIYTDPAGMGGANEDYDAPDFQNMLLAWQVRSTNVASEFYPTGVVVPSLHRPELLNYWHHRMVTETDGLGNAIFAPSVPLTDLQERWRAILRPDLYGLSGVEREYILQLKRKISLRPLREDHPNFTGSNPAVRDDQSIIDNAGNPVDAFDALGNKTRLLAINGPWDVDNTGDGKADSVWVDLGFSAQIATDGRQYKPLFAILCLDLDGRLNLNAHGNLTHLDYSVMPPTSYVQGQRMVAGPYAGGTVGNPSQLIVGQGYGPAEINLGGVILGHEYFPLLAGQAATALDGRYGERTRDFTTVAGIPILNMPHPGWTFFDSFILGTTREPDWAARVKFFDYPGVSYWGVSIPNNDNPEYHDFLNNPATYRASAYGTPPDIDGNGVVGVDLRGVPYWPNDPDVGMADAYERIRNPYKLDLSVEAQGHYSDGTTVASVDRPYTLAELERVLRFSDLDSTSLPDRLLRLATETFATPTPLAAQKRSLVTTDSWDLPTPSMSAIPADILVDTLRIARANMSATDASHPGVTISDTLLARLVERGSVAALPPLPIHPAPPAEPIADILPVLSDSADPDFEFFRLAQASLLAPELLAGLRIDINRPFGNGRDDDAVGMPGHNVVDEPGETETIWPGLFPQPDETLLPSVPVDITNDNSAENPGWLKGLRARQEFAKHLYCLAWLIIDEGDLTTGYLNTLLASPDINSLIDAREELARQLAQWAINVVDFRDSDSIMTPFEYDIYPFEDNNAAIAGTWDVDGDLSTPEGGTFRGVVWGCERPELLITETRAFHDRRTEWNEDDEVWEQRQRPEGSLYVELYNPNNPLDRPSGELHAQINNQHGVDLQRATPGGDPVWRMLIAQRPGPTEPFSDPDVDITTLEIERSVYFTTTPPTTPSAIMGDGQRYYRDATPPMLPPILPGRYAVVGSPSGHSATTAHTTYIGRRDDGALEPTRKIVLAPSSAPDDPLQVLVENNDNVATPAYPAPFEPAYPDTNTEIQPPIAIVISEPRRLSVSEPLAGYPGGELSPGVPGYSPAIPPIDSGPGGFDPAVANTSTVVAFRAIHLQRLANPLLDWNPEAGQTGHNPANPVNPYLTVDTMPIDLTAFNGEDSGTLATTPEPNDMGGTVMFASRQRGETAIEPQNIWCQEIRDPGPGSKPLAASPAGDGNHRFDYVLQHSLGYLNMPYGNRWGQGNPAPVSGSVYTSADYRGAPQLPFPWLTWNNRPFISQYELLHVPAERSSRLLALHGSMLPGSRPYEPVQPALETAPWYADIPYKHLPNFLHGDHQSVATASGPYLYRLFEFLHVPSRFVGTETVLNPASLTALPPISSPNPQTPIEVGGWNHRFRPPFNRISRYREPGKINTNTIFDTEVWQAVMNWHPGAPNLEQVFQSRRGYGAADLDPLPMNDELPTRVANPFRSFGGKNLVPLDRLKEDQQADLTWGERREIDVTLLRSQFATANKEEPLFGVATTGQLHNEPLRNPYFRYQALQKLGNLVTTRSNVYAVWVTVGFFEVEQGPVDAGHPDGYRLGRELGIDTGEVRRHRAFYVFDRSIPVGFQRGQDHNVERAVRLRRFIE